MLRGGHLRDVLDWPHGTRRLAVVACVGIVVSAAVVHYPDALGEADARADGNAAMSYADREFAGGNAVVADQGGLYWARVGHVGRDLLPETEDRLFSPDSRMTLEAADLVEGRARTLSLAFGSGRNLAERVAD